MAGNEYFGFNTTQTRSLQRILDEFIIGTGDVDTAEIANGAVTGVKLGAMTSLQLKTALSDETGSGAAVFATSPTLVTPALGTPTALVLTSATGLVNAGVDAAAAIALSKLADMAAGTEGLAAASISTNMQSAFTAIANLNAWATALATKLNAEAAGGVATFDADYDTDPQA